MHQTPIITILHNPNTTQLIEPTLTLLSTKINLIKISLTNPNAYTTIKQITAHKPTDTLIKTNTILTITNITNITTTKTKFIITPTLTKSIKKSIHHKLPMATNTFTPTKILATHQLKTATIKIFPTSTIKPTYIHTLRDPFPQIPLLTIKNIKITKTITYLKTNTININIKNPLLTNTTTSNNLNTLTTRTHTYLDTTHKITP